MIKLASWNVNSLKVRLPHVLEWLKSSQTDILALQETKLLDENFPKEVIEAEGYHVSFSGQKTYNGVAVISKYPIKDVQTDIDGLEDVQRRIMACTIEDIRVLDLYVPNGSEVGSDKYEYKLMWLEKVTEYIKEQIQRYPKFAVVGDFNIAPEDIDVHDPESWKGNVLVSREEREAFQKILDLGLGDSFRILNPESQTFSWWDYRAAAFRRNMGLRIDHVLLSKDLMSNCENSEVDKEPRKWERPSDHAPAWVDLQV